MLARRESGKYPAVPLVFSEQTGQEVVSNLTFCRDSRPSPFGVPTHLPIPPLDACAPVQKQSRPRALAGESPNSDHPTSRNLWMSSDKFSFDIFFILVFRGHPTYNSSAGGKVRREELQAVKILVVTQWSYAGQRIHGAVNISDNEFADSTHGRHIFPSEPYSDRFNEIQFIAVSPSLFRPISGMPSLKDTTRMVFTNF
jgi:hypothetical protein